MPTVIAVYIVVLVLFTPAGPSVRMIPTPDFDTCERLATGATAALTGQKVPVQMQPGAEPEQQLVIYAEGRCVTVTKKDAA